jgi:vacuolar-type H+-ATPase subunit F/Vma7
MADAVTHPVRNIFIGGPALTNGFRLIGFETLTNPDLQQLDRLLADLQRERQRAFLIIEQSVSHIGSKLLDQVRSEGGRIVLSEVPSLYDPNHFQCELDAQLKKLTGG